MKKMILTVLCALMFSITGNAQTPDRLPFAKDKFYTAASLSGLGLTYTKSEDWHLGLNAKCGYLFEDNWMVTANAGYDWFKVGYNTFTAGAGLRYYIEQNGLFLGAGANYVHHYEFDDFMPTVQLGYTFFLNRTVTLEPEIYYNQSLKDHSLYSGVGFRIGFGIYFE